MTLSIKDPTKALQQLNILSRRIQNDPATGPKAQDLLGRYLKTIETAILPKLKEGTEAHKAWIQCVNFAKPFAPMEQEVSSPSPAPKPEPVLENPTPSAVPQQEDSKEANPAEPLVTVPSKTETPTVSTSKKTTPAPSSYFSGRKVLAFGAIALAGAVVYASECQLESALFCGALALIVPAAVKYVSRAIQNQPTTPVQNTQEAPEEMFFPATSAFLALPETEENSDEASSVPVPNSVPISAPTPKRWTPEDFRASEQRGVVRGELREQIRNRLSPIPSLFTYVTPLFEAECVPQSDLGLQFTQLNQDEFLVSKKDENSLFDQLGFKEEDRILNNSEDIKNALDSFKKGQQIRLNISRNIGGISRPAVLVISPTTSVKQEDGPPVRTNSISGPTLSLTSPPPASSLPIPSLPAKPQRKTVNSPQISEEATQNIEDAPLTMEKAVQNFNAQADKYFGNIIAEQNAQLAKVNEKFTKEWEATASKPNVVAQTVVSKTTSSAAAPEKDHSDVVEGNIRQFQQKLTAILGNTAKVEKYRKLQAANTPGNEAQYASLVRDFLPKTNGDISVPLSVKPSAHVTISGRKARKPTKRVGFKANSN